jgi:uncharacterized protein YbjT (DUF2867 family)
MSLVFVAGATGRIGALVARLLLDRGHDVLAGARDPRSPAAAALERRGARVVRADFDDVPSLTAAARDSAAVVSAGTAHRAGPDGERRHGVNLADAVARAGAPRLVYISGAGADRPTGVPVFESKRAVEARIRELGLDATVLAPVYLMENALNPWNLDALARGRFPLALPPDRPLQQIAIADVATMAVVALEQGEALAGARVELASDELTGAQAAARLSRATGRRYTFERVAVDALAPPLRVLFAWLERDGFAIDLHTLRERHPEVGWRSFERWAAGQTWPGD